MARDVLSEVMSSRTRLSIAGLIAGRPRTLPELSDLTGVSVQGVLRHLKVLSKLGLVEERKVRASGLPVRKLYGALGRLVSDFSTSDFAVVRMTPSGTPNVRTEETLDAMEYLAEEALVSRRRIREQVRRLPRLLDELAEDEKALELHLDALGLDDFDRAVLMVYYTEESPEEAERVLRKYYGLRDGRRSIEKALEKAKRVAKAK